MIKAEELIRKFILKDKQWKVDLLSKWQTIQSLSNNPIKIQVILDKTLVLGVSHPAIAQQLSMSAKQILKKLKELAPSNTIERLAFQVIDVDASNENKLEKKNKIVEEKTVNEQQLSICHTQLNYWKILTLSEQESKSLNLVCCTRLKQALKNFYARCKRKEALNVQNQRKQVKDIAFVDSPFINLLALN